MYVFEFKIRYYCIKLRTCVRLGGYEPDELPTALSRDIFLKLFSTCVRRGGYEPDELPTALSRDVSSANIQRLL
jgi:hypothetical protein